VKPPAYLEKAAGLEEQEENLRRNHSQSPNGHSRRRILPTPPQLPRHLDKVILNARAPSSGGIVNSTREGRSSSISGQGSPSSERGRATHPNQGNAWPTPMTGLSPGGTALPGGGEGGRKGRRDSGGSGGSADRSGVKNRRGSSSMDVGVYGGLIVTEGGGMTGFGAGIGSPIGDDNSVLPLPSHSVVNHLATSAIRNGVLAVATTTRYKAKVCTFFHLPSPDAAAWTLMISAVYLYSLLSPNASGRLA
jgi:5'-AMP-activated protein kinase beta subunit, interaction domain